MKIALVTILFSLFLKATAQQPIDSIAIGKVIYLHHTELASEQHTNGTATLFFNTNRSLYVHNNAPTQNTTINSINIQGDPEGYPIYKSHADRRILFKTASILARGLCVVEDTLGMIDWRIYSDRKRFGRYECRKALGIFRGREYEAWFTLDIPISSGPHKLGGLPGLILEARSLDGQVTFLFSSLEMSPDIPTVILPPKGKYLHMNYAAFKKAEREFARNKEKEFRAKGVEITITPVTDIIEIGEK